MSTKIEIVNLALTMIGSRRITSLTAQNDIARTMATVYTPTVLEVLEANDWTFARKQETMTLVGEEDSDGAQPIQGWDYLYAIPNLCIKVRTVFEDGGAYVTVQQKDKVQNFEEVVHPNSNITVIASDVQDALCYFTSRVEDPSQFSPSFVKCLAAALAAEVALPITMDKDIAGNMANLSQYRLLNAASTNSKRENKKQPKSGGYIDCR